MKIEAVGFSEHDFNENQTRYLSPLDFVRGRVNVNSKKGGKVPNINAKN
jgi:hypothetical protein